MRAILSASLVAALGIPAWSATQPAQTTPLEPKPNAKNLVARLLREGKIMRARDAKRGMRGYALSVFQGTTIERFNIEVVGTLERVNSGGDLVMIRILDGPVVKRQSGIIQGMSGSPVYINGKLLGAIAIGFGFPKEPIGGVTPITQMIEGGLPDNVPPQPNPDLKTPPVLAYRSRLPLHVAGRAITRVEVTRDARLAALEGTTMRMRPCTNYLLLSGISPSGFSYWQKMFSRYDVTPVLGGGTMGVQAPSASTRKTGVTASLIPGAGIGVQLASGDVDFSGIGTVTYRIGNRVLAFGHPMFGLGAVSMPMTTAYVHDIFPAYDISFKLASPIKPVGELQQDTTFAVGGTVGRTAQMIPMTLHVRDDAKGIDKTQRVRLIQDPIFTPQLALGIALDAFQSQLGMQSSKMLDTSLTIRLRGQAPVVRTNTTYSDDPLLMAAVIPFFEAMDLTQSNPYEKGAIQSISLDAKVVPGRKTATIRRILADRNRVKAGDTVNLSVALSPTNQPDVIETRRFSVRVPADAPDGVLRVAVSPANSYWAARSRVGGAPPRPGNLSELLQAYARVGRSDELLLQASTPRRFLLVDRKRVDNPPASWNRLMGGAPSSSLGSYNETIEERQSAGYVVDGLETIAIPVESARRSNREKPDAAGSATTPGSDDSGPIMSVPDVSTSGPMMVPTGADMSLTRPNNVEEALRTAQSSWKAKLFGWNPSAASAQPVEMRRREISSDAATTTTPPPPSTPSASATGTPTATPTATPDPNAATIARPVGRWIQKTSADFARGEFSGAEVGSDGTLGLGPVSSQVVSTPEAVAWSVASAPDGSTYIGTGNNARLFRVQNGVARVIYEGREVAVSALAVDGAGNVYAGASPGGRVYRFAPDGTRTTVFQSEEAFIGALTFDDKGSLLVGTGGNRAAIYRVENPATTADLRLAAMRAQTPLATLSAKHVRSLAFSNGAIYAGTADSSTLVRVNADGRQETLYEARVDPIQNTPNPNGQDGMQSGPIFFGGGMFVNSFQTTLMMAQMMGVPTVATGARASEVTGVAPVGDTVYFSLLSSGSLMRWTPARGVEEAAKTGARAIYSLRAGKDGSLYAGTGDNGQLFQISPKNDGTMSVARVLDGPQSQVTSLDVAPDGHVVAGTSNNAALWTLAPMGQSGQYTSNVFDAGSLVRWGTLRALGNGFVVETRSGQTSDPDATWSAFAPLGAGGKVQSAPARYLQYRVTLSPGGQVQRVETSYRAPNRPPVLAWSSPAGGEYWSGKKTLTWTGTDPDQDPLRYSLEIEKNGAFVPVELSNPTQASFELDTSKYPDGAARLRLRASDATRNPDEPKDITLLSLPFTIDNTAPTLGAIQLVKDGGAWKLTATGSDATSPLAGAEWRVLAPAGKDGKLVKADATKLKPDAKAASDLSAPSTTGDAAKPDPNAPSAWTALGTTDGFFDSGNEILVGRLDPAFAPTPLPAPLSSGTRIEIRLRDAAGNATSQIVTLP